MKTYFSEKKIKRVIKTEQFNKLQNKTNRLCYVSKNNETQNY